MFVDNTVYINFVLIVIDFVKAFCYTQIAAIAVWFDNRRNTGRQKLQMICIILNNAVLLFNFHTLYEFRFSGWLICTTWPWVMTQQPPWRHYRGVIAVV